MSVAPANLKNVRVQAADWLERQQRTDWNESDAAELRAWLAADPTHAVAFYRVEFAWQRTARLAAFRPPMRKQAGARRNWLVITRSAALLAGVALVGLGVYFAAPSEGTQTYTTDIGARKTLSLADGSKIELNTNTVLRISKSDNRRVWLDHGEAYFEVVHNANHPFIVDVGQRRITDLGTKFDVRHDATHLKLYVLDGSVSLASKADATQSLVLARGDSVVANGNALKVKSPPLKALKDELGWRRGVLVFDGVTLAQAASEFNRYSGNKILVTDPDAASLRIVGTFPTDGVDGFLDVAHHILKVRVERRDQQVIITR